MKGAKLSQIIPHTSESPDLAASAYYLFPDMETWQARRRFLSHKVMIAEINGKAYYSTWLDRVISLKEDCVEKYEKMFRKLNGFMFTRTFQTILVCSLPPLSIDEYLCSVIKAFWRLTIFYWFPFTFYSIYGYDIS